MSIPSRSRAITTTRDLLILDTPISTDPSRSNRCCLFWDSDRDERIIDVAVALRYREPRVHQHLIAMAESQGIVRVWVSTDQYLDKVRDVIQAAANAATDPFDRWTINTPEPVAMCRGVVDRLRLAGSSLLRTVPAHYDLGVVRS